MTEFEIQRALDLPEPLPADEPVLWIGSPTWGGIARNVFHLRTLTVYFVAVIGAHALWLLADGSGAADAVASSLRLVPLGLLALCMFALLAWLTARSTTYALTDRRVFMRIGIALSITLNLPYRCIASADLRLYPDGSGDLPLSLSGSDRMAYLHLWPHARPWRLKDTVPMLLSVPDAAQVGAILGDAIRAQLKRAAARQRAEAAPAPAAMNGAAGNQARPAALASQGDPRPLMAA